MFGGTKKQEDEISAIIPAKSLQNRNSVKGKDKDKQEEGAESKEKEQPVIESLDQQVIEQLDWDVEYYKQ